MRIRCLICVALASLVPARLSAHDFWLAAANWTPAAGTPVTITAGIGERFPTRTEFATHPEWFDQWRVIGASGDQPVTNAFQRSGLTMTTDVRLPAPGAYLGVMQVRPLLTEMKGPEFTDYLEEEGLHWVIAARAAAGEAETPGARALRTLREDRASKRRRQRRAPDAPRRPEGGAGAGHRSNRAASGRVADGATPG